MSTTETTSSQEKRTLRIFLTRGLAAILWAAIFAAGADSLTLGVGVLLVLYPLIDAVANLIDARNQRGSARRLLLANAAVSTVAAVLLAVAATGSIADVLAVFGGWALVSGAAQLATAIRRRALLGKQWLMRIAGVGSIFFGVAYLIASTGANPKLSTLAIYAAGGGIDFVIQAGLLARRRRQTPKAEHGDMTLAHQS
jgi:uncharacterized membrane protein HdeD (DUF308 family)